MIHRSTVHFAILWLLLSTAACQAVAQNPEANKPTRKEIIAFAAQCKQQAVPMDLVGEFGTDFSGLDLRGVDFRGAYVNAKGEHRPGLRTILRGANFAKCRLQKANFEGAVLDDAILTGADLADAIFESASLRRVTLQDANVVGTEFFYSNLAGAKLAGLDLSQSDITAARFPEADLSNCTLAGAKFHFTWQVDFHRANLNNADLHGLTFSHSNFQTANLRSANLSHCDLRHSDFSNADLQDAVLTNAQVGAAVFQGVRGLSDAEMRRISSESWRFALKTRIVEFLDSVLFPVGLLLVVPLLAVVTRTLRRPPDIPPPDASATFQFRLSTVLLITAIIGVLIGVAQLSLTGAYSYAMVCAFFMMVAEAVGRRPSRRFALGLLAAAFVYTLLNVVFVFAVDPLFLLDLSFGISLILAIPLLAIVCAFVAAIIVRRGRKRIAVLALMGFAIWAAGVGVANLWVLASAAAAV